MVDCGMFAESTLVTCHNLQTFSKYREIIRLMLRIKNINNNMKLILQNFGLKIQGSVI